MDRSRSVLSWPQRLSYGVGHALNDLTASMWFTYLIVYLQLVLEFDATYAGMILLIGQIVDAVATPLLGFEASAACKDSDCCKRYGRRKMMHLIGTICVLVSFPFIFTSCPSCFKASVGAMTALLIPIVLIFQFGWAASQISHLSLIPILTPYEHERDILTVVRYVVDIMSDIITYMVVWMVFDFTGDTSTVPRIISPKYASKFVIIVIVIEVIGAFFSLIFHLGVKEVKRVAPRSNRNSAHSQSDSASVGSIGSRSSKCNLHWSDWLKEANFYQIGFLFMLTRLFANMSSIFTPLYLQENLGANDDMIAKIPLVMNISAFVISFTVPKLYKLLGKKLTCLIGCGMGIGACAWVSVGEGFPYCSKGVYGVALLLGASTSLLMVTGLSFVHDLIGTSTESGSFVYGCMSFCDKLANGIAAILVQYFHTRLCFDCDWFYKNVLAFGIGGIAVICALTILTLLPRDIVTKSWTTRNGRDDSSQLLPDSRPDLISYGALTADECIVTDRSNANTTENLRISNLT